MITLLIAMALLPLGYWLTSRVAARLFSPDDRDTPAITRADGVDYVRMNPGRAFLIQLLNIAGTGPIFGALMGAQFGPIVYLWIVLGSLLGGGVHDYLTGMISCRHDGESIPMLAGLYLGRGFRWIMRVFSLVLLVLVGTVFVTSPASLLARLTPGVLDEGFWTVIILLYFVLATILPIDKLIGRLYPLFGLVLLVMAFGIFGVLIFSGRYALPEFTVENLHPDSLPVWPYMCVTVACGAISGFHSTQSPMIARCITKEKHGRPVFYGAMIAEAAIALVWAAAGVAFYETTGGLSAALASLGQSGVVYEVSFSMMGALGGILAVVGVVVCPITSGDTAFRSARLILAEWTHIDQKPLKNRLLLTLPLLVVSTLLMQLNFDVLWRYFAWSNQTLATVALWMAAAYFLKKGKYPYASLIAACPGSFMTGVVTTYILMAPEGFRLSRMIAYPIGMLAAALLFGLYLFFLFRTLHRRKNQSKE